MKYPVEILNISISFNHKKALKYSYQKIKFSSERNIIDFVHKYDSLNIPEEIRLTNKPLIHFINFLKSTTTFLLTEECKSFLYDNRGTVQCLVIKYLIYQFYHKKINKDDLSKILDSFQWNEISALLIKEFIQESEYTEKLLLDKLNIVFKRHFEVIGNQNFERKAFLDNFTIHNILNICDGRKYYNAELWQKNGSSRWYVKGNVSTYIKGYMNCYCEGRPWKKESLWNSQTNTPSSEKYDFYWCKTSYCASRNDSIDLAKPFQDWRLSEISHVLNISVEKIALATLAVWVNRMNQIIEHLFCRDCNAILRPLPFKPSTLGYYAVPLFHCINENCENKQVIRFTHCLNGKCESHKTSQPLDSRDCQNCRPNDSHHSGLQCNYCDSKCPSCSGHNQRVIAQEAW